LQYKADLSPPLNIESEKDYAEHESSA